MNYENKLTRHTIEVLKIAKECANEMGHEEIGTEHLLLAMIKNIECFASRILRNYQISEKDVYIKIENIDGINELNYNEKISLDTKCKHILELSYVVSRQTRCKFIGTEHILYAMLKDDECIAQIILEMLGVNSVEVSNYILNYYCISPYVQSEKTDIKTPCINKHGVDLTLQASKGEINDITGRENEIAKLLQTLSRVTKNNVCLIGEPGVGKTAIVEGLSCKIAKKEVPPSFYNKRIISLSLSSVIAGTKYRGEFEERINKIVCEAKNNPNIILFIDEIHNLMGAGGAEGAIDAANILKPALSRGEIQIIGATTIKEYKKHIEKDMALERRFQQIIINPPSVNETIKILNSLKTSYEEHYRIKISDEAIKYAVEYSEQYLTNRFLPDKAIDILDEAAAMLSLNNYKMQNSQSILKKQYNKLMFEMDNAIGTNNEALQNDIKCRSGNIALKLSKIKDTDILTKKHIAKAVSAITSIPITDNDDFASIRYSKIVKHLSAKIIGQDDALKNVCNAIKRNSIGIKNPNRPICSFLFAGPTGVGKTQLAKELSKAIFNDYSSLIKLDMSEYMESHSVSKLIGAPPGYIGYEDGGKLTETIKRKPYSIILFDEIEKAHKDVLNILLQILEDGILTDSAGQKINFKNTLIILTTNIGSSKITEKGIMGFNNECSRNEKGMVQDEIRKFLSPELLNRIDEIIVFNMLKKNDIEIITKNMLNEFSEIIKKNNFFASFSDECIDYLVNSCTERKYGARPLRSIIRKKIADAFTTEMIEGKIKSGDKILFETESDEIKLHIS